MPQQQKMAYPRRQTLTVVLISAFLGFLFVSIFRSVPAGTRHPDYANRQAQAARVGQSFSVPGRETLMGHVVADRLGNETAKAELGRASWKYFHTVFAQFPDEPTADESVALESLIYLFARLYPCGECAAHFQAILAKFPPQTSTRSVAAAWGCHVHNEVNKSLGKDLFDCSQLGDFYKCGCAEGETDENSNKK